MRACLRCIAKKRRCDHERPVCGSCGKLKVSCEYPPPQSRRGPVPGLSKRAEWRVQQCENALWYLLGLPGVSDAVKTAIASGVPEPPVSKKKGKARRGSEDEIEQTLPSAPTSELDREARAEWWSSHRLDTPDDILEFQRACMDLNGENSQEPQERQKPQEPHNDETASDPQTYTPASSSLRNSMGPSLWQLVTAAIPDADDAAFARELRELRARREREQEAQESNASRQDESKHVREMRLQRERHMQLEREVGQGRDADIEMAHELDRECRRRREAKEAERAAVRAKLAAEGMEMPTWDRTMDDRAIGHEPLGPMPKAKDKDPLVGMLGSDHLAWTYGANGIGGIMGMGGVGGAGKRRRLEDMFLV